MNAADRKHHFVERVAKPCYMWLSSFGFNPLALRRAIPGLIAMLRDCATLRLQNRAAGRPFRIGVTMPCLTDRYESSGSTRGHYFYQDWLVARRIFERQPVRHVDVGSRVDGFVAHVASFREIDVFDIRPLSVPIPTIRFCQADLMDMPDELKESCDSLSCLHAIEHIGLGRYGDSVDLYGHAKGFGQLVKLLKPQGILYLSVPIGPERIDFNANRVFDIQTILGLAKGSLLLEGFSYIDDDGLLHQNVAISEDAAKNNFGCQYGCGIFEFRKSS